MPVKIGVVLGAEGLGGRDTGNATITYDVAEAAATARHGELGEHEGSGGLVSLTCEPGTGTVRGLAATAEGPALRVAVHAAPPVTVMLELEWVLRSRYGFTPDKLSQAFTLLCALPNVTVGDAVAVRQAAGRLAKGWDFADALHHALSEGCVDFLTFDDRLVKRAVRSSPKASPPVRKP